MAVWVVRGGRKGRREEAALQNNIAAIGWKELPDLSSVQDRERLRAIYRKANPTETEQQVATQVGQVWAFLTKIEPGDLVVLPRLLKVRRSEVAIGKVTGPYSFRNDLDEELHHARPVQWLRTNVSRISFPPDLRKSLDRPPTVYQVYGSKAEERILALVGGTTAGKRDEKPPLLTSLSSVLETVRVTIAQYKGKKLTEEDTKAALINPVLCALGWHVGDLSEVRLEYKYAPSHNPVDYALMFDGRPRLLVEAKALGQSLVGWADAIMGYAGASGVKWVVLTNGDEYRIYNACVDVPFDEKLLHSVCVTNPDCSSAETLAWLSKGQIGGLDARWQIYFADRQVRSAIDALLSPVHRSRLVSFIRKQVKGLTNKEIAASVSRVCSQLGFRAEGITGSEQ